MRNYKKERENYHSRPEQMVRNAARKRARRSMEREGKAKAGDGKDVHHKDNNPLNNDKNNLSLVTQHYNRREPRLRQEDVQEMSVMGEKQMRKKVAQAIQISGSAPNAYAVHQSADAMRKSTRAFQLHFQKQKSSTVREIIAKAVRQTMDKKAIFFVWDAPFAKLLISFSEAHAPAALGLIMVDTMQKYLSTRDRSLKKSLLKKINVLQRKLGLKVTEDIGTVTGTHISGTGDDSSTVLVKKKKKQKKKLQIRFKLKNQKSLKKRIIDHVLAIQQKV